MSLVFGCASEAPRKHLGGVSEARRRLGGASEELRRHLGSTSGASRRFGGASEALRRRLGSASEAFRMLGGAGDDVSQTAILRDQLIEEDELDLQKHSSQQYNTRPVAATIN